MSRYVGALEGHYAVAKRERKGPRGGRVLYYTLTDCRTAKRLDGEYSKQESARAAARAYALAEARICAT